MTNGNDPINVVVEHTDGSTMRLQCTDNGLSKREYFAAMALQGLLANPDLTKTHDQTIAMTCIDAADALINALNQTEKQNDIH